MTERVKISHIAALYRKALHIVNKLGLPPKLLHLLCNDALEAEVERAQAELDRMNDLLDAWELANPAAAALAPWAAARQAWKDAGRPRSPWYEIIRWSMPSTRVPISGPVIERQLYAIWFMRYQRQNPVKFKAQQQRRKERALAKK